MKSSYYLGIYLPILSLFFTFYVMVLIVIFLKRKDDLLGSTFFAISFFLGITELGTVISVHGLQLIPMYGIFVDFYLQIGGIFPVVCNYVPITLGTLQYMIISVCSLNRLFVIIGATGKKKEFYDKLTVALCILAIVVSALAYSPITFATKSIYADFRTNTTSSDDLIIVVRCVYDNQSLLNFAHLFLLIAKSSNVLFALVVYSIIFSIFCWNKKNNNHDNANKDYTREAKLAGAVFIHTIIAATGTFFFIAMFFIWPEDILNLLDTIYVLEDTSRMFSPILLILFSKPLRIAFIQTYWKVKSFNITSTNAKTLTTPRIQASKITIVASTKQIATRF